MVIILNIFVLIWSFAKFRKLSKADKAKAKGRFVTTNLVNVAGFAASLLTSVWATIVTPPVPPMENPIAYEPTPLFVVSVLVFAFCLAAGAIGISNIRKYSSKRSTLLI